MKNISLNLLNDETELKLIELGPGWSGFSSKQVFIETGFHRNGFSSNGFFIECTISSSFQNCKLNFCSTSTSKVIDDLVRVTL